MLVKVPESKYSWRLLFSFFFQKYLGKCWQLVDVNFIMITYLVIFHVVLHCTALSCMHGVGFGQGFRRSVFAIAAILGPIWVGGAVSISYYLLLGVPFGLLLCIVVSFLFPVVNPQAFPVSQSIFILGLLLQ